MKHKHLLSSLVLGLGLVLALLWVLGGLSASASTASATSADSAKGFALAPGGVITVCQGGACDYAAIQDAVDAAAEGDVIKVATGVYTGVTVREGTTQTVYISKTVTVRGGYTDTNWEDSDPVLNPTTIDAEGQGWVFYITGAVSPTLEGLRITGGYGSVGAGVYVLEGHATLSGTTVISNSVTGNGGGVYVLSGSAVLSNTQVSDNSAGASGGGICVVSGAVTLASTDVTGNEALSGGGVYVDNSYARLRDASVASNDVGIFGGGLYIASGSAALTRTNVISNRAAYDGGGIYVSSGSVTLSSTHILSNSAQAANPLVTSRCGGVYVQSGRATLNGTRVQGNFAEDGGGGLCAFLADATLSLSGGEISHNTTPGDGGIGGGIYVNKGSATLTDTHLISNSAEYGGGVYVSEGSATLDGAHVMSNSAEYGAGMYTKLITATLEVSNGLIDSNSADKHGGGLYVNKGSARLVATNVTNNSAVDNGGGVYVVQATASLSGTHLINNSARDGGGIRVDQGSATLTNTHIISNSARYGGGANVYEGSARLTQGEISDNTASSYGGGLYVQPGSVTVAGTKVLRNSAVINGGGIWASSATELIVTNGLVASNTADGAGGGFWIDDSPASLVNATIADNVASSGTDGVWASPLTTQTVAFTNTILWNNGDDLDCASGCTAAYSDLQQGVWPGTGNISQDPLFADPSTGDYHLPLDSPCVDAGTKAGAPGDDFEGDPRPWGFGVDIGADEFTGHIVAPGCYDYLDPDGVGTEDVQFMAAHWRWPAESPFDPDGDGIITIVDVMRVAAAWSETCP